MERYNLTTADWPILFLLIWSGGAHFNLKEMKKVAKTKVCYFFQLMHFKIKNSAQISS